MDSQPHDASSGFHAAGLPRVLGLWDIVSIMVGGVIGSGLFIVPLSCLALYLATNLAYLFAFPTSHIGGSDRIAADVMSLAFGPVGASAVALVILFAMSKDGLFFRHVADVHPLYRTPHISIVAMGIWAAVLSLTGTFQQLFTYVIFGQWIFFGLTVGAVLILRRRRPELARPYRTTGYPLTPALFTLAALLIIALGLPAYFYWKRRTS